MDDNTGATGGQVKAVADVVRAWEGERARVAARLYGDVAQRLSTALLYIEVARKQVGDASTEATEPLEAARTEAEGALREIRRFARELHPPELEELGPVAACEAYARDLAEARGVGVTIRSDPVDPLLKGEIAVAFYRVLHAALTSALRPATANRPVLEIRETGDGHVEARLEDDGTGSDPLRAIGDPSHAAGFFQMAEQLVRLGGRVEVEQRTDEGTRLRVRVPVGDGGDAPAGAPGGPRRNR